MHEEEVIYRACGKGFGKAYFALFVFFACLVLLFAMNSFLQGNTSMFFVLLVLGVPLVFLWLLAPNTFRAVERISINAEQVRVQCGRKRFYVYALASINRVAFVERTWTGCLQIEMQLWSGGRRTRFGLELAEHGLFDSNQPGREAVQRLKWRLREAVAAAGNQPAPSA